MNDSPSTDRNPASAIPEKMSFLEKLSFGAGDMGPAITANVLVFFLAFFFTDVAGLPPALAAWILAIGKVWDAVNDPIVGFLSDRTESRWGRRHPWMIFGAIPFGIFFFLQWIIPDFGNWGKFWFYVAISILFNMAYTIVNLPYTALTPELTQDYNERTSLNSFRFAFSIGGSLLSLILAAVIFGAVEDLAQRYILLAGVCTVLSVVPLYLCVWGTRKRVAAMDARRAQIADPPAAIPFLQQIKIAFTNVPFLYVMGIYLCSWLGVQVTATIIQYYVVSWMELPGAAFTQIAFAVQATALLMLFVWTPISRRVGKRAVYFMGMSIWIIAQAGLFFLQPGQVPLLYVLAVMAGVGVSTAYLIPWSMLPDVIDLDELKTGQRREGVFYAFMVLLQKIGLAIGLFLVLKALDWAGYIESTAGQPVPVQPDSALFAIRIAIGPLPTIVLIGGMILAYLYPITQTVHAEILLKLQEKRQSEL
ncbi:MAG: MFS transporter [Cyanobacteriota bacterium]|nr:MFS transporter [Cyanobacteriota bacterium]